MASKYDARIPEMTRNLVTLYRRKTIAADIALGLAWYPEAWRIVSEWATHYGRHDAVVACVIAAISPQCAWERNLIIADDILAERPVSVGGALHTNLAKARAMLACEPTEGNTLITQFFKSGPKVSAFALNLQGHTNVVTVDTHALQAALADVTANVCLKWQPYQSFAQAYTNAADKLGIPPCHFQAIIWHTWKRLYPKGVKNNLRRKDR